MPEWVKRARTGAFAKETVSSVPKRDAGVRWRQHHRPVTHGRFREQLLDRNASLESMIHHVIGDAEAASTQHAENLEAVVAEPGARGKLGRRGDRFAAGGADEPGVVDPRTAMGALVRRIRLMRRRDTVAVEVGGDTHRGGNRTRWNGRCPVVAG